jgi:tetratricopeptide (TPR) repeat protein
MTKCILEIHADPSLKSVVFADIDQHSKIEGEQEVLFGLNATFKVGSIDMDSKLQRIKVTLTATDDGATHFEKHMKQQQYEMKDYCPMVYFGRILWRDLGRADQAKKYFDMLLKALPPDHPDMSDVYNEIAPLWAEMGDQDKALEYYEKAYAIREKTLEQNHPKISISLNNIGITYAAMGKHDDALDFYRRSLAINKEITPEPNQDWALRLLNIGIVYRLKKEYDRALEFVHQAYDIYKRIRPDQHRDIAWCLGAIGDVYYEKGNIDRALDYYHQQLEMNEKCLSLDHPDISANLQRLADIYVKQGERPKALSFCEQKLVMQENTLGKIHPRIASTLMTIGKLRGEYRNYLEQALNILEKYTPKDDLRTIECLEELADLDMKENNLKDSLAHWMCILDIRRRIHSPDNPKIGFTLWTIGDIYFRHFQNYSEALHYSLESLAVYCANYGPQDNNIIEINRRISMIHAILDDDEDDCKDAEENMTDHLSSSESVTDTPASTTLSSLVTPSNSSASTDQTKNNASSGICVLL